MGALVLNASYEPLTVVSVRRAVTLVLSERAEVVEDTGKKVRSERAEVSEPAVIRLVKYVRVPFQRRVPLSRRAVLRRDNFTCAYCGGYADTIDHVIPRARGGTHTWDNLVASCAPCNHKKGDKLLKEVGYRLPFTPKVPVGTAALVVAVGKTDPKWEPYIVRFT